MNHEYVVFEKLMDSDFDFRAVESILSSGCLEIILEYILLKLDSL
jgi:hypothetical protein